jgi:hypothetical protein
LKRANVMNQKARETGGEATLLECSRPGVGLIRILIFLLTQSPWQCSVSRSRHSCEGVSEKLHRVWSGDLRQNQLGTSTSLDKVHQMLHKKSWTKSSISNLLATFIKRTRKRIWTCFFCFLPAKDSRHIDEFEDGICFCLLLTISLVDNMLWKMTSNFTLICMHSPHAFRWNEEFYALLTLFEVVLK